MVIAYVVKLLGVEASLTMLSLISLYVLQRPINVSFFQRRVSDAPLSGSRTRVRMLLPSGANNKEVLAKEVALHRHVVLLGQES